MSLSNFRRVLSESRGNFGGLKREIDSLDGFRSPFEGWKAVKKIFARRGLKVVPHDDERWNDYENYMKAAKNNDFLFVELATRSGELIPFDLTLSWADTGRSTAERVVFVADISKY